MPLDKVIRDYLATDTTASPLIPAIDTDTDPLEQILTGGIYAYSGIGKQGLTHSNPLTADAFAVVNGQNKLQPCVVVKQRGVANLLGRRDAPSKSRGTLTFIQFWLYDSSGFDTIELAVNRLKALLHEETNLNIGYSFIDWEWPPRRAQEMDDAPLLQIDFALKRVTSAV